MDDLRSKLAKRAITLEVGGFRPNEDPLASWFGRVNVCAPGESWPTTAGQPMHALCQINVRGLPYRPPRLTDIEFLTLFIGPNELPMSSPNGSNWCLRAYGSTDHLVLLPPTASGSVIKPFPMRPRLVPEDFPCWDDIPIELPADAAARYHDDFENVPGMKLGGWPTLIQSEIYWAPWNRHPAAPEYVFQIDSCEKAMWSWGHGGVGYFGRGTVEGKEHEWACEWQCL